MADRRPLSKRARFAVLMRDGFRCVYCGAHGRGVVLQVDHVQSVADGGEDHQRNLATACSDCNNGKGRISLRVAPGSPDSGPIRVLERIAQEPNAEEAGRIALGMTAGFLCADYSLSEEMQALALSCCNSVDFEVGQVAAALPSDPLELARVGLALFLMLNRTDPASRLLMNEWQQRIAGTEGDAA